MAGAMSARFGAANGAYLHSQRCASDRAGMLAALSRVMRLMLQSAVLGLGAYLVIIQEATAGVIIASSILMSRALAPVELAIAIGRDLWLRVSAAAPFRAAYGVAGTKATIAAAAPRSSLAVEAVSASPPGEQRLVVQD